MRRRRVAYVLASVLLVSAPEAARAENPAGSGTDPAPSRVVTPPTLVTLSPALYPEGRDDASVAADVLLTLEIDQNGAVTKVQVARSGGDDFDEAALRAARGLVFSPAMVDGKKAAVKISYLYQFKPLTKEATPEVANPPPVTADAGAPSPEAHVPTTVSTADVEEVRVRAPRAPREAVGTVVSIDEGRRVPGTQGDALKVVENLPGVARPAFGTGQLVVWGSAPRDTRIYVDGVEIPALYHGSGLRSTLNADLVRSLEFLPGAFGADYGRGLGGVVRLETKALPETGAHGYAAADLLDASGMVGASLGHGVRVAVAGRQSYVDRILQGAVAPDVGDFFSIPRYRDYQAKATFDLGRDGELAAVFLGSDDSLTRALPASDPSSTRRESTHTAFHRGYLRYTNLRDDGSVVSITPFVGYDTTRTSLAFGTTPANLEVGTARYGVRASHRIRVFEALTVAYGIDALGSISRVRRAGSLNRPAREGDISVFGQPPGDDVNTDDFSAHILEIAPYVSADLRLGPLTITPGVRANALLTETTRSTPPQRDLPPVGSSQLAGALEPRIAARVDLAKPLSVTASAGYYHQAPAPEDLSAVFGTPDLTYERSRHLTLGATFRMTPTTTAEVTGFAKSFDDLVARTRLPTPRLARALIQDGEGRSMGVQLLMRQSLWRGFFGWISYAASRSQRRYYGDPSFRPLDYDQPHVLSVVASQDVGTFTIGARLRVASGMPRTPVLSSYDDPRGDRYVPIFGIQSSERLPTFFQLDLRAEKAFQLGAARLSIYVDVQNVTARKNAEEYLYSYDYRSRGVVTGLPTLAVAGARVEL